MSAEGLTTLDTNVLVRILVDDPGGEGQITKARDAVKHAKQVYIPQIVQVESVWVFQSCYNLNKTEIISILEHLQQNEAFVLQQKNIFDAALNLYKTNNVDFADCLILAESLKLPGVLLTFDKRFARLKGVKLL